MGGSSYSREVESVSSSGGFHTGGTSSKRAKKELGRQHPHPGTVPRRTIQSLKKSPIVVALDVTGSNREFARIAYDKAPMLHGQIEQQGYLGDFDICFAAIGDAYCDEAPLQVCDFRSGLALDEQLKKLFLEGGGGGQQMESYELAAYYFAENCSMPNAEQPFLFFIGDEAPYPSLQPPIAKKVLGATLQEKIDTKTILQAALHTFKGNVFFLQNTYCGQYESVTRDVREKWRHYLGEHAEKALRVREEKAIIDIILGTIAMVSQTRDLESYTEDMKQRSQTDARIGHVRESLESLQRMIARQRRKSGGTKI